MMRLDVASGSFLTRHISFLLSCFLSWDISRSPTSSSLSVIVATTCRFLQLDQSPESCVGFHLPHLAAPSLPAVSSSLLVFFSLLQRKGLIYPAHHQHCSQVQCVTERCTNTLHWGNDVGCLIVCFLQY